ncbi:protein translocase subunit SecD [bacterium]|nr:protein translocase subunit SecD [candidate division CSSED10-310 bacterium]
MSKIDLKWRILFTVIVIGVGLYMMYPPLDPDGEGPERGKINLGLDLQGGMHMVMEVVTEEAVQNELVLMKKNLESMFRKDRIRDAVIDIPDDSHRLVITFPDMSNRDKYVDELKDYASFKITTSNRADNYDLIATMESSRVAQIKENALDQALLTIRNRIDELGVSEPVIQKQKSLTKGELPRILVQLPGIKDIEEAKDIIGKTALLEFRLAVDGPATRQELLEMHGGREPANARLYEADQTRGGKLLYYLLEKEAEVTGADLDSVRVDRDDYGQWAVAFTLSRDGGKRFARLTQDNMDRQLAIVLDGKVQSAPVIRARISRNGQITGDFTFEEAKKLMIVLKSGALPASVIPFEERTVGPSLGHDSISRGIRSIVLGGIVVILFMAFWYRVSGLIADIGMIFTLILLLGVLASLHATLTLPGIAGIILTIGMAVDANVLIFERIREELRQGKTVRTAVANGYSRAFITIMDANITTLIAAVVLLQFGMGPIRGFAVTLSIGVVASMFVGIFVSRVFMDSILARPSVTKISI